MYPVTLGAKEPGKTWSMLEWPAAFGGRTFLPPPSPTPCSSVIRAGHGAAFGGLHGGGVLIQMYSLIHSAARPQQLSESRKIPRTNTGIAHSRFQSTAGLGWPFCAQSSCALKAHGEVRLGAPFAALLSQAGHSAFPGSKSMHHTKS